MKGKAIAKIVICSVVALVLIIVLSAAVLTQSLITPVLHLTDKIDVSLQKLPFFGEEMEFDGQEALYTGNYQIGNASFTGEVKKIELFWSAGSVTIRACEGEEIVIRETEQEKEENRLRWKLEDGELTIHEYRSGYKNASAKGKTLEILLPAAQAASLQELKSDGASADVTLQNIQAQEIKLDTASGNVTLESCIAEKLDVDAVSGRCTVSGGQLGSCNIDTTSGDVQLETALCEVEIDNVSAKVSVKTTSVPDSLEMQSVSGDCELLLPKNAGFVLKHESVSGNILVDGFENLRSEKGEYRCGDGSAKFDFESISGDFTVRAIAP